MPLRTLLSALLFATGLSMGPAVLTAHRAGSPAHEPNSCRRRLIPETRDIAPGDSVWMAVRLRMKEHWHTYWRNPGDTGLPTEIKWTLPSGFTAGPIQWPVPSRMPYADLMNYGYENEVVLLQPRVRA